MTTCQLMEILAKFSTFRYFTEPAVGFADTKVSMQLLTPSETLQMMECIPRSPSPQPDKDLTIQRLEEILREKKQQISELKVSNIVALEFDPTKSFHLRPRKHTMPVGMRPSSKTKLASSQSVIQ